MGVHALWKGVMPLRAYTTREGESWWGSAAACGLPQGENLQQVRVLLLLNEERVVPGLVVLVVDLAGVDFDNPTSLQDYRLLKLPLGDVEEFIGLLSIGTQSRAGVVLEVEDEPDDNLAVERDKSLSVLDGEHDDLGYT